MDVEMSTYVGTTSTINSFSIDGHLQPVHTTDHQLNNRLPQCSFARLN